MIPVWYVVTLYKHCIIIIIISANNRSLPDENVSGALDMLHIRPRSRLRELFLRPRLIHMYPAAESSQSESGPVVTDDYFLRLFSLEEHQWRIIPHRNVLVPLPQRMVVTFYKYTNMMRTCTDRMRSANDTYLKNTIQHKRQLITRLYQSRQYMF